MKRILILLVTLCGTLSMEAQQELMVSQYMFNGLLLNPAYAGTHDYFSASLLHRSQWAKFDGAPTSQVFAIDGPIANNKLGVGLMINNDQIGVISQLDISANIAYHLQLGKGDLSFGLRAGGASYSANLSDVVVWDGNDQVYSSNDIQGKFIPKFGFGVYYHSEKFFAGLSVPVIYALDDDLIVQGSTAENYFTQHYYANVGVVLEPSTNLAIKPSILVKVEPAAPVQVDMNCNFLLYRRMWIGVGYRTGDAIIGMLEYNITPQLRAGYAYDFTTTDIGTYSNGSHEIMLGFDFGKDLEIKKRSPRYF